MIDVNAVSLAGFNLANECDPRVSILQSRLLKGVAHLEQLREEGVVKTNFMRCDDRSIYVFDYLFVAPRKIASAKVAPLRQSRNQYTLRQLIALLARNNMPEASVALASLIPDCDTIALSDQLASLETRVCRMIEMHTIIYGILLEVLNKSLSTTLQKASHDILDCAVLPEACRPALGYVKNDDLMIIASAHLDVCGYARAAAMVRDQTGRHIW